MLYIFSSLIKLGRVSANAPELYFYNSTFIGNLVRVSHAAHPWWWASIWYFCMYCTHVFLNGIMWMEAGEPGILIMHGFLNRWYFTSSISSPGSGFIVLIEASSGKSAGEFCGERSCITRGEVEGVMEGEEWMGEQYLSLHPSHSVSQLVSHSLWVDFFVFC